MEGQYPVRAVSDNTIERGTHDLIGRSGSETTIAASRTACFCPTKGSSHEREAYRRRHNIYEIRREAMVFQNPDNESSARRSKMTSPLAPLISAFHAMRSGNVWMPF